MLYHVPSGSKSSSTTLPGLARMYALRFATEVTAPLGETRRITLLRVVPCEQPPPPTSTYKVLPMKATSAAPLTRPPESAAVWLDGISVVSVLRTGVPPRVRPPTRGHR